MRHSVHRERDRAGLPGESAGTVGAEGMTVSMHHISCIRLYKDMIQLEQQRELLEVDYD